MWKQRLRKFWPLVTIAVLGSAASGYAYQRVAAACCEPGAACCKPGAACCANHKHDAQIHASR